MDAKTPAADDLTDTLRRIAEALERLSPRVPAAADLAAADAFVWHPDGRRLVPVPKVNRVDMGLLRGIDRVRDMLMDNFDRSHIVLRVEADTTDFTRKTRMCAIGYNQQTGLDMERTTFVFQQPPLSFLCVGI